MDTLKERLRTRLPNATKQEIDVYNNIVERYNLSLTVRNLDAYGLLLFDTNGKTVRITFGEWRNGQAVMVPPNSDIAIVVFGETVSGWVRSEKLDIIQNTAILDLKFLSAMPENDFMFVEDCPHLETYGGFTDGEFWECFGCGRKLIFNE